VLEKIVFSNVEFVELELIELQEHVNEWAIVNFPDELFGIGVHLLNDVESHDIVCPDEHLFPLFSILLDTLLLVPLNAQLFEIGTDLPLLQRINIKIFESLYEFCFFLHHHLGLEPSIFFLLTIEDDLE